MGFARTPGRAATRRFGRWLLPACILISLAGIASLIGPRPWLPPAEAIGDNERVHDLSGGDDDEWSVLLVGDVQEGFTYLPWILDAATEGDSRAVILLGDVATRGGATLALPGRTLARHRPRLPIFAVPGNHDLHDDPGGLGFRRWFGALDFDVRVGRTRLIGIDNGEGVSKATLDSLETRLRDAQHAQERVALFMHRDLPVHPAAGSDLASAEQRLLTLIRNHGVAIVICGHRHQILDVERDGTRFVAVPPSGDRSHRGRGLTPISTMWLRWDGNHFTIEQDRLYRSNANDARATLDRLLGEFLRGVGGALPIRVAALMALLAPVSLGVAWTRSHRRRGHAPA